MSSSSSLSAGKAKEILRHGSVRGHPLTEKQKRYMGWVAGGGRSSASRSASTSASRTASSRGSSHKKYGEGEGEEEENPERYRKVIRLLNQRTEETTKEAIGILEKMYGIDDDPVGIYFDKCIAVPPAKEYLPYKTGYANRERIVLCPDILTDDFNVKTHSKSIGYNMTYVTHYAAVVLHEFGHVLDKRSVGISTEKTADSFAVNFIKLAKWYRRP